MRATGVSSPREESVGVWLAWRWSVTTVLTERYCGGYFRAEDVEIHFGHLFPQGESDDASTLFLL